MFSLLPLLFPFLFLSYLSFSLFFFFFFFSCSFSYSCYCSCSFSFSSLSSLLATKHYGKNRSTNTAANIEAFECDLAQGKCTAVGSLPPLPPSSFVPLPPTCVVCGEAQHTLSLSCSLSFLFSFPFFFSLIFLFLSSFSFSFSLAPSLTLALVLSLFLFLLYSLLATKHYGKNRSTNTANIESFECDLVQGKCTAVGSLPPPLPSLLSSLPPSHTQKNEEGTFYCRNISGEEFFFITVLNKIKRNAAGEKLQSLQFYINSKTIGL